MVNVGEFKTLSDQQLNSVVGGNVFKAAGVWVGKGLYWFAKGASAIKG